MGAVFDKDKSKGVVARSSCLAPGTIRFHPPHPAHPVQQGVDTQHATGFRIVVRGTI
jgi:hypothetical protein